MHIPDGFLSAEVAAGAGVVAVAAVGAGLHRAGRMPDERQVPLLGVTAAFVFAAHPPPSSRSRAWWPGSR